MKSRQKNSSTELVFILDASGSMYDQTQDVIGGFNRMIDEQKHQPGKTWITTILFDSRITTVHDRKDILRVRKLDNKTYRPGGSTALYDAIGYGIEHIRSIHKYIRPEDVPEKTIFAITTDGMENASTQYTQPQIKKMIEEQREKGWEFIFLAENIDTITTAQSIGIAPERAASYSRNDCSARGTMEMFTGVSEVLCAMRMAQPVADVQTTLNNRKSNKQSKH